MPYAGPGLASIRGPGYPAGAVAFFKAARFNSTLLVTCMRAIRAKV